MFLGRGGVLCHASRQLKQSLIEGDKSYVYKINEKNIANKTEVNTGLRGNKNVEIISGLSEGDIIVAEGLKKVRPQGKIKPINK